MYETSETASKIPTKSQFLKLAGKCQSKNVWSFAKDFQKCKKIYKIYIKIEFLYVVWIILQNCYSLGFIFSPQQIYGFKTAA